MKGQSLLLLAWLLLATPVDAQAQFTYTTNNGTITITGYTGGDAAISIPSEMNNLPVTAIGDGAFSYSSLISVTIPNSVTTIGSEAFGSCSSLTNVTMGNSVANIGGGAFWYCPNLTNVTIPNNVTNIGAYAFYYCTTLTSVTIPNSVTRIGDYAFRSCNGLTNVIVGSGVTDPHMGTFAYCGHLTSTSISNGVNAIWSEMFVGCSLLSITIPNTVTSIGASAFGNCALTNLTIPDSVTNIGEQGFSFCTNLARVYFQGNAPSADSSVFYADNYATAYYLPGRTGWGSSFGGIPTALWLPQVQVTDTSFGVKTNQFGFNLTWADGLSVVIEASPSLRNPVWSPLATNTLVGGSFYFTDPQWTNYPTRFYRVHSE